MSVPQIERRRDGRIEWTPAVDAVIRARWSTKSADQIAADLGVSKGAIIGRAHRIGLPAKPRVLSGATFAPARRKQGTGRLIGPTLALEIPKRERGTGAQALGPTLPVAAEPVRPVQLGPVRACCFPMWGDKRPRAPKYCEKPSKPGKSYCPRHYAVCYHPAPRFVAHSEQTLRERTP